MFMVAYITAYLCTMRSRRNGELTKLIKKRQCLKGGFRWVFRKIFFFFRLSKMVSTSAIISWAVVVDRAFKI